MRPSNRVWCSRRFQSMRSPAFTLIELLVVLAVIGVIIALVFPALRRGKQNSMMVMNIHNLKQIGVAYLLYAGDHNGEIPHGIRHNTGLKGPWFGSANAFGAPARRLFSKSNSRWGINAEGDTDYLTSPDPLYSPLRKTAVQRPSGTFSTDGQYGYVFMYSPAFQPLIPELINEHTMYGARMPICSDYFGDTYKNADFISDTGAALYLDGSVRTFPQAELDSSKRDFNGRFRYLMNN